MARNKSTYRFISKDEVVEGDIYTIAKKFKSTLSSILGNVNNYHKYKKYYEVYKKVRKFRVYGLSIDGERYLLDEAYTLDELASIIGFSTPFISTHLQEYVDGRGCIQVDIRERWEKQ